MFAMTGLQDEPDDVMIVSTRKLTVHLGVLAQLTGLSLHFHFISHLLCLVFVSTVPTRHSQAGMFLPAVPLRGVM